jgi:hypothetical protein
MRHAVQSRSARQSDIGTGTPFGVLVLRSACLLGLQCETVADPSLAPFSLTL